MIRATFAGFTSALSAMQSNSKKLDVTSQNLANMNVDGYTRQKLQTSSLNYENPTSFYMNENDINVGFGVSMDGVTQMRDQFLDKQYRTQNAITEYNNSIATAEKSIATLLDETNVDGIRKAFDGIQTALTSMQDPSKVNDSVYEAQLRSSVEATTNLLNNAAREIELAEANEFHRIDGTGTSENGAIQNINRLLQEIGDLNVKIKENQILNNSALEMMDQRNVKLDELSKIIPIRVSSFYEHDEVPTDPELLAQYPDGRNLGLAYDKEGRTVGKSNYPEDIRVELVYTAQVTDSNGTVTQETRYMTLVNGSLKGTDGKNYGSVGLASDAYTEDNPLNTAVRFTGVQNASNHHFNNMTDAEKAAVPDSGSSEKGEAVRMRLDSGSLQASMDMLAEARNLTADALADGGDPLRDPTGLKEGTYFGYDYYMKRLDLLANTFAEKLNVANYQGTNAVQNADHSYTRPSDAQALANYRNSSGAAVDASDDNAVDGSGNPVVNKYLLLVNRGTDSGSDRQTGRNITAKNITVSDNWSNGYTHIGTQGDNTTDTILDILQSMTDPHSVLQGKCYSDYMNNISTTLANDARANANATATNQAVLDAISSSRDQISGVSMDEEAANMMTYVSSYNAAAKLMTTLDEMLQTLLAIKG
ncbi:flagellar basal body rod C-terminal domain-containing protein [[Clostridium] aminophilum]|uniref:flagellar hook-associated protein FlgK n=1 Tax=[Clostridium] aminophilum TaxID=1526 RepID=UPI00332D068C